jgi:hypothetical protein
LKYREKAFVCQGVKIEGFVRKKFPSIGMAGEKNGNNLPQLSRLSLWVGTSESRGILR